jgi:glycosyltransferase involved in cell wall biosynthesis
MTLLGDATVLQHLAKTVPDAVRHEINSKIYTVREQVDMLMQSRPRPAVWWSPHYNIPLAYRGPLVVTVHDLFHLANPELAPGVIKRTYARLMFNTIRRRAQKVICVSQFTADEFTRLVGGDERQREVIHNGLDESWFDPISDVRPQAAPYFLFVGNVKPHKNIRGLVSAFTKVMSVLPHDLVIVGQKAGFITGDRHSEELAKAVGQRAKFTGSVDLDVLRQWYRHADALIFPSFYEGFGFPPLEAMAVRCPVVTSNAASLPEICGDAALYCDPHDIRSIEESMLRIAQDHGLREELRTKGLAQAKRYRWADSAAKTAAILGSFT